MSSSSQLTHLKGSRVLLAEDCPDTQMMLSFLLEGEGVNVTVAGNGQECFEIATRAKQSGQPFDMILMDIQMPVMDGLQTAKLLRQSGYSQPIVALTARCGILDMEKSLESGCDDHISKLVGKDNILSSVDTFLTKHAEDQSPKEGFADDANPMLPIVSTADPKDLTLNKLILEFIDNLEPVVSSLEHNEAEHRYPEMLAEVQKLHNAEIYGFNLLAKLVKELTRALQNNSEEEKKEFVEDILSEIKQVAQRICAGRSIQTKRLVIH